MRYMRFKRSARGRSGDANAITLYANGQPRIHKRRVHYTFVHSKCCASPLRVGVRVRVRTYREGISISNAMPHYSLTPL